MLDFLNQLFNTLPTPIAALVVAIMLTLLTFACLIALWLFLFIVALIPGTDFLFVDLEEKLARSIEQKLTASSSPRPRGKVSNSYRIDPRNRHLQHQLIEMLQGDVAVAKRLLRQQRKLNPGQSDNWYLEKVIYDLERDRRC